MLIKELNPLYSGDLLASLKQIYAPKDVVDLSSMDQESFQFLIALNNKGYFSHDIEIEPGIMMHSFDPAIKYKPLYYLEVSIEDRKLDYSFWKYPKNTKGNILRTSRFGFNLSHRKYLKGLKTLAEKHYLEFK